MLERIAVFLFIILGSAALYTIGQHLLLRRRARHGLGFSGFEPGRPAILYFTAPGCVPCKTIQRPALIEIREQLEGYVQIFEFNAAEHTRLANQWAVLSVPTTFVIDPLGRPRKINSRPTSSDKLIAQIREVAELPEALPRSDKRPVRAVD